MAFSAFQVISRTDPGVGVKDPAEIKLIPVAYQRCDILDVQARVVLHQALGLFHAQPCQILSEGLSGVFPEQLADICLRNGKLIADTLQ